jgi:hydroxyacylglutathione hydrolase
MKVEQIYTGCLAEAAYYIESKGEAVIIDPLREVQPYIEKAAKAGAKIKYVLETHFHADFVSGHVDLAKKTGATIVYGPTANPDFDAHIATDGEILQVGDIQIKVLHTPGHTMESTCYLLLDENGKEKYIFTGDTLFIGDVGRPDLAQKAASMTQEELAGLLYERLHSKIIPLPDDLIVYPGHGAGSACGKNMSKETFDTLGNQKKTNYALKAETKEQFIKEVTDGLLPPPYYFPQNVKLNKEGYTSFDKVMDRGKNALSPDEIEMLVEAHQALILDTRQIVDFAQSHIPGSIFIGIDGDFAPWVGTLITDIQQPLIIVTEPGREEEVITRLARVGYENILGYAEGSMIEWEAAGKETDFVVNIHAEEMEKVCKAGTPAIIDVRKETEYVAEHLEDATNIPLASLNENMACIDKNNTTYIHCAGGYRSMTASSILKARGYHNIVNIDGGFAALKNTCLAKTAYVCPSTLQKN